MAIAIDATNTPAAIDSFNNTSLTAVTASFSPSAGSLVLVAVVVGLVSTFAGMTMSVVDSGSTSYTAGPSSYAFNATGVWYFTHYYASAPGSITLTVTRNSALAADFSVKTLVLTGAAASQAGAAAPAGTNGNSTTVTGSITPTVLNSWAFAASGSNSLALTASGLTDDHNVRDGTDGVLATLGHVATASLSPATIGWTSASCFWVWAALEVLPAVTGTNTSPAYAASYNTTAVAGTGSWANPAYATGAPDGSQFATWTAV